MQIATCLWFDGQAEEAANFYVSVFKNSRILGTTLYGEAGQEIHGQRPGSVMTVQFELNGRRFTALNGGPIFKLSEAFSLVVPCETAAELDHYWEMLSAGGDPSAQQCGWLKDKFGLSWQVVPAFLDEALRKADPAKRDRIIATFLEMKKLDFTALERIAGSGI